MNSGMLVIAAVLAAIIIVPTFLIIINTKKQSKALLDGLNTIVAKNNGVLSQHTEQKNFALGIDKINHKLFFYKKTENFEISKTIDLSLVNSCEIVKRTRNIKDNKNGHEVIEKILLSFNSVKEHEHIELYSDDKNLQVNSELITAEDWKKIIDTQLKQSKVKAAVA